LAYMHKNSPAKHRAFKPCDQSRFLTTKLEGTLTMTH